MLSKIVAIPSCAGVDGWIDAALSTGTALFSIAVKPLE
jgi:hypothetical protein